MSAKTPAYLLLAIQQDLQLWQQENNALISIASDPFEVIELLAEGPARPRVILLWKGDTDMSGDTPLGIVRNDIEVTLSHNRGLLLRPGQSLYKSDSSRPSLIALLDSLRARIRSLVIQDDQSTTTQYEYKGCEPVVTPEGLRLDAYTMRFQIFSALTWQPDHTAITPSLTA